MAAIAGSLPALAMRSKTPSTPSCSSRTAQDQAGRRQRPRGPSPRRHRRRDSPSRPRRQMLVDFSRPVELQLREQNLCSVLGDVLALAAEELSTHNVTLVSRMPSKPLMANFDADLVKQALLNVIQNGAQAMARWRALEVSLEDDRKSAVLRISDRVQAYPTISGKKSSTFTSPPKPAAAALASL